MAGVILPQPHHGVKHALELREKSQWGALLVDRDRGAARRVDTNADDCAGVKVGNFGVGLGQRSTNHGFESVQVVLWILTGDIGITGIGQHAHIATGVVEDGRTDFGPVIQVYQKGAAGIRTVINTEGVTGAHGSRVRGEA